MKHALIKIATTIQTKWAELLAPMLGENGHRFRSIVVVAHTTEGEIMDGPRGLQLITPCGPTPVYETPNGFLAYNPQPHILESIEN